jgi:hypothetical protein
MLLVGFVDVLNIGSVRWCKWHVSLLPKVIRGFFGGDVRLPPGMLCDGYHIFTSLYVDVIIYGRRKQ